MDDRQALAYLWGAGRRPQLRHSRPQAPLTPQPPEGVPSSADLVVRGRKRDRARRPRGRLGGRRGARRTGRTLGCLSPWSWRRARQRVGLLAPSRSVELAQRCGRQRSEQRTSSRPSGGARGPLVRQPPPLSATACFAPRSNTEHQSRQGGAGGLVARLTRACPSGAAACRVGRWRAPVLAQSRHSSSSELWRRARSMLASRAPDAVRSVAMV